MAVITCTHCGATGNAPDQILGQQVRCSKCKKSFVAGGEQQDDLSSITADEPPPPEDEDEGFPTNEDIASRLSRSRDNDNDDDDHQPVMRRPTRKQGGGSFVDFITFRRMVAPYIIMILFWLGTVLTLIGAVGSMIAGIVGGAPVPGVVGGLVMLIVGPLAVRLWCEVMIVIFRISENLTDIRDEIHKGE
jgi:hypothetical protein